MRPTPEERFWAKVKKGEGCWEWQADRDKDGYGVFYYRGRGMRAHRFSYELHKGPIPPGMLGCHSCDNPSCVNPDHIWPGTHADNQRDRDAKGRLNIVNRNKTHCPKGHPYDDENTYRQANGRFCRACQRAANARSYRKRVERQRGNV